MPKGRMLNKRISYDEKIAHLSIEASLLYTWCIPHLDVKGRIYGDSDIIKGLIVPYVRELTPQKIDKCIEEISKQELITIYGKEHRYIEFNGFLKNQSIYEDREAKSDIPEPTQELHKSRSRLTPQQVKLSKVNISKEKEKHLDFVLLTNDEFNKLISKYGQGTIDQYINKLNNYIGSKGKKYPSHYFTILSWANKDGVAPIKPAKVYDSKKEQEEWEKKIKEQEKP